MRDAILNSLLFFPDREIVQTPADVDLDYETLTFETDDGELLHGWWVASPAPDPVGHVLLCHGNAGNIGDRVIHARLLADAGLDTLLFDYRGYGRSSGRPSEQGTYRDARAARRALLARPGIEGSRVTYLGESLGGAVVIQLALESPPGGAVLSSAFTSVRDMARHHYPLVPRIAVPDAYPSLRRIPELSAPLLLLHGEDDEIVPADHARALADAAPGPKRLRTFPGVGHNDLVPVAARDWAEEIASFARDTVAVEVGD